MGVASGHLASGAHGLWQLGRRAEFDAHALPQRQVLAFRMGILRLFEQGNGTWQEAGSIQADATHFLAEATAFLTEPEDFTFVHAGKELRHTGLLAGGRKWRPKHRAGAAEPAALAVASGASRGVAPMSPAASAQPTLPRKRKGLPAEAARPAKEEVKRCPQAPVAPAVKPNMAPKALPRPPGDAYYDQLALQRWTRPGHGNAPEPPTVIWSRDVQGWPAVILGGLPTQGDQAIFRQCNVVWLSQTAQSRGCFISEDVMTFQFPVTRARERTQAGMAALFSSTAQQEFTGRRWWPPWFCPSSWAPT